MSWIVWSGGFVFAEEAPLPSARSRVEGSPWITTRLSPLHLPFCIALQAARPETVLVVRQESEGKLEGRRR